MHGSFLELVRRTKRTFLEESQEGLAPFPEVAQREAAAARKKEMKDVAECAGSGTEQQGGRWGKGRPPPSTAVGPRRDSQRLE